MHTHSTEGSIRMNSTNGSKAVGAGKHAVLRYAKKWEWSVAGLPDHGECLDVLWRIISDVERNGMHLGRWSSGFRATYGAFIGSSRPRSHSRHGFLRCETYANGGVTPESGTCFDLSAYESYLTGLTGDQWVEIRTEAREFAKPKKKQRNGSKKTSDGFVPAATPCLALGYCPYGVLVESFPLSKSDDRHGCDRFGHVCPVFTVAKPLEKGRDGSNGARN